MVTLEIVNILRNKLGIKPIELTNDFVTYKWKAFYNNDGQLRWTLQELKLFGNEKAAPERDTIVKFNLSQFNTIKK